MTEKGSTKIETIGRKDGRTVRLVCECGYGVPMPVILIQDEENFPPKLVERWDEELDDLSDPFVRFRGVPCDPCDPVIYSRAMTRFYDEEPKKTITGYQGWFEYTPGAVY